MKVVISGSFRKHLQGILDLKNELEKRGITVLKPDKIQTVDNTDRPDFVKFEGEESLPQLYLKMQYLKAIEKSDAHIIYNQDSYIGRNATYELYWAEFHQKTIYLLEKPDLTKMINMSGVTEEWKKEDIAWFYYYLLDRIEKATIIVGIDQLYKDFNIEEPKIAEIDR